MGQSKPTNPNRSNLLFPAVVIVVVVFLLAAGGGFTFAATQESRDAFCAACHTEPESTYVQRSVRSSPVDLASFHTAQKSRCIDCHSGPGLAGRMAAELMGARNAVKWYTGTAIQPAVLTYAIGDGNCLKCHQQVVQKGFAPTEQITPPVGGSREGFGGEEAFGGEREGHNNHWHELMTHWQAASPTAGTCVSCHSGHSTMGTVQAGFMVNQSVEKACDACHQAIRHED